MRRKLYFQWREEWIKQGSIDDWLKVGYEKMGWGRRLQEPQFGWHGRAFSTARHQSPQYNVTSHIVDILWSIVTTSPHVFLDLIFTHFSYLAIGTSLCRYLEPPVDIAIPSAVSSPAHYIVYHLCSIFL